MENPLFDDQKSRARIQAASPLMFESDEEDSKDEEESTDNKNKENADKSSDSVAVPSKEQKILKGFQTVLMGIPPPPAFTVPQFDSREILKLWRDNYKYRVVLSPDKAKQDLIKQTEEEASNTEWPEVAELTHWGIYYNRSTVSEDIETLSVRYKERYVGAETASCINVLYVKSPSRTASARKRMRQLAWGHSPGRRLSHLARRRRAFSSANLCSVAGNSRDKKMIMVEIKKMGNRQTKRNSAKKTKPTPKKKVQTEASTFKRALFQSPDQLPNARQAQTPNSQRVHRSKRNLFANSSSEKRVNENGKRERIATRRISPRKRVNRTLSFQDSQAVSQEAPPHPRTSITQVPHTSLTLTGAHKQKMLWAATNALREEGMGMNHELFRPCMTVLFKTCQKLWLTKLAGQDKEGSTSENMLALTKQFSAFTIKEISADPTSEHMAKVYNDMLRMAETVLNQANGQKISSTSKQTYSKTKINEGSIVENQIKNNDNSLNTFKQSETSKQCSNKVSASNSNKVKPSSIQKRPTLKQTPLKFTSTKKSKDFSPKNSQNLVQKIDESADTSENSGKLSTPKGKNKLNKGNKLTSPSFMSPLTRSRKSAISQNNSPCNFTSQESDKLSLEHSCADKCSNIDTNSKSSKSILSQYSKKSYRDSTDDSDTSTNTKHKIIYSACSPVQKKCNSKKFLSQEILDATLDNKSCDGFEKNKENIVLDRLTIDNQKVVDSSHRLLSSVENTPQAENRTLQLYKLSNSGGEHVDPEDLHCPLREPPKLMAPWNVQPEDTFDSVSQSSPPVLIPHWEQPVSGTSTSLPDSIMSHWQQMSASSVNTSDKIMFDYEDTSYEIVFPPTNEDDTRASSVCVPFDYPHLVEDSKSCFNSVFITEGISGTSNSS